MQGQYSGLPAQQSAPHQPNPLLPAGGRAPPAARHFCGLPPGLCQAPAQPERRWGPQTCFLPGFQFCCDVRLCRAVPGSRACSSHDAQQQLFCTSSDFVSSVLPVTLRARWVSRPAGSMCSLAAMCCGSDGDHLCHILPVLQATVNHPHPQLAAAWQAETPTWG